VFLTGHTGFKGAWLSVLLSRLGAQVHGFALPPEHSNGLFSVAGVEQMVLHRIGDVRDLEAVRGAMAEARPSVVIHMAAQSLVRRSYVAPVETYATNVMGTVNLLEAIRSSKSVEAAIVVTSDKCYEDTGSSQPYREGDRLGGRDPYSNSKGCAELVTAAYRQSFFSQPPTCLVASARAGNVIGGGDWAEDRLVPDAMRAFMDERPLVIRNPRSIRPWQHVLDPLAGYLVLAQSLAADGARYAQGWNFGPSSASEVPVEIIVQRLIALWGGSARWQQDGGDYPHEAATLRLDCARATEQLGWCPLLSLDQTLRYTVEWYTAYHNGGDLRAVTAAQIEQFLVKVRNRPTDTDKIDPMHRKYPRHSPTVPSSH
jgi:CDP-glucose 4,6-dehydratase